MSEETTTLQAQSTKAESGLDRLSRDFDEIFAEVPTTVVEAKKEETATEITEKLENPEIVKEEKAAEIIAEPVIVPEAEESEGFTENAAVQEENQGWKPIIEAWGYQLPPDYNEENGFEVLTQLKEAEFSTRLEEVKNYREAELFSELPEDVRDEAKLTYELFKSGQTLEQINAPIQQIKEWKSMPKEELIRSNLEGIPGYTPEMIDHKMSQIVEAGHVDIEYKILRNYVDQKETELVQQRQQQIQIYSNQQAQIKEKREQTELNSFKAALDKVPTFMDRKLSAENKNNILNDYASGYVKSLTQNPEKLAKFMLYDRFGQQGLEYLQARALEKATLEKAKSEHNIPINITGAANVIESTTTQVKNGMERLSQDMRYA